MGDLPYISSEQGGVLIICTELLYEYTMYKRSIPIQELWAEEAYNTYYTVWSMNEWLPNCHWIILAADHRLDSNPTDTI